MAQYAANRCHEPTWPTFTALCGLAISKRTWLTWRWLRYDTFAGQPAGQHCSIARRTGDYPAEGLDHRSDAAVIAALVGGYPLAPPLHDLLTRVGAAPARNCIFTVGYTGGTPAIAGGYV